MPIREAAGKLRFELIGCRLGRKRVMRPSAPKEGLRSPAPRANGVPNDADADLTEIFRRLAKR